MLKKNQLSLLGKYVEVPFPFIVFRSCMVIAWLHACLRSKIKRRHFEFFQMAVTIFTLPCHLVKSPLEENRVGVYTVTSSKNMRTRNDVIVYSPHRLFPSRQPAQASRGKVQLKGCALISYIGTAGPVCTSFQTLPAMSPGAGTQDLHCTYMFVQVSIFNERTYLEALF